MITLVADPDVVENIGEVEAQGDLGSLFIRVSGEADPINPKTSAVVGASVISALANRSAQFAFI
jgi:predicted dinucleotide-utilizing enzyme